MELVLILLILIICYLRYSFKSKLILPGPKGFPYIGNIFQIKKVNGRQNLVWTAIDWAKEYGIFFKFKLLGKEIVVLSSYEAIYEVLVTKSNDFAGRPQSFRFQQWSEGQDVAFTDFNTAFKVRKKIAQLGLKQYGEGITKIQRLAQVEIEKMIEKFESQEEKAFDPRYLVRYCVLRIMESLIVGEHLSEDDSDTKMTIEWYTNIRKNLLEGFDGNLLDMLPWTRYFGNRAYKAIEDYRATAYPQWTEWIERCKAKRQNEEPGNKTLLVTLLEAEDAGTITRTATFAILMNTIGAGIDTTHGTTCTFLILMVNHPEYQNSLYKEVQEVVGERLPQLSDKPHLPLMEATLFEVLRYSSIAPLCLPHKTTCDTTVMGTHLPKDTQVWLNLWAMHHDDNYFDQPYNFDPTRFLDSQGKCLRADEKKSFLPFGAGSRVCMGEVLVKERLFLMFTRLVQKFEFLPEAPDKIPSPDMRSFEGNGLSIAPPAFKLRAKPRH